MVALNMRLVFILLLMPVYSAFSSPTHWDNLLESYVEHLDRELKRKSIPGAALTIVNIEHGDLILGLGQTQVRNGSPITPSTRFRLASVSKTFAGSLASKLVNQGAFSLEDTIEQHLPEHHFTQFTTPLTVFHLLTHSSGLVPNAYDNLIESKTPYPQIIDRLTEINPICLPGKCYGYQNALFSLIGDITKKSTGLKYEELVMKSFFQPLEMEFASIGYAGMVHDNNYAHPHVKGKKKWRTAKIKKNYYKVLPAAGINASASDMKQWLKAQLGLYPDILDPKTLKTQNSAYTQTKKELKRRIWRKKLTKAHYGLGWRIYDYAGETLYYHSGWVQGYRADIVIIPRLKIGFNLMINAETGLINELTTNFLDRVLANNKRTI